MKIVIVAEMNVNIFRSIFMSRCIYCNKYVWFWQDKVVLVIRHTEGKSKMPFHLSCGKDTSAREGIQDIEELSESTTEE